MAPLATVLCIGFIAWLLIRDARRRPRLGAATWIPTLVLFTISSRTPSQWLGESLDYNTLDQAYFAGLILASLIILSIRPVRWGRVAAANRALLLFYGYFALSALWSYYPGDSLTRLMKDFGLTVVAALLLLSDKRASEAIRAVYVRCACVAFPLSLLYAKYYDVGKMRDMSGSVMYGGIATQKNSSGDMAMVYLIFVAYDYVQSRAGRADRLWNRRWWGHLALLVTGTWTLFLTQSKTSLVGTAVALALLAGRKRWATSRTARAAVLGAAFSLPVLTFFAPGLLSVFSPVLKALGRDASLSGRTAIWQAIDLSTVNPLIGAGFWNFWSTNKGIVLEAALVGEDTGMINVSSHNAFLDVYLDGGMIGVAVLVVLVFAAARQILRSLPRKGFHVVRFIFLVVVFVCNVSESFIARPSALWFTTVLVFLNYPFRDARDGGTNGSRVVGAIADS